MTHSRLPFAVAALLLLTWPGEGDAQQFEPVRPSIVVDAFSFTALLESAPSPIRYSPVRAPYPMMGRPAPLPMPGGGWGGLRMRGPAAEEAVDDAPVSASSAAERPARVGGAPAGDGQLAQLGQGIADLLVERLLRSGRYRVLERQALEALERERRLDSASNEGGIAAARLTGARYYLTGSVTRFGTEDRNFLGGGGTRGFLGLLGVRRRRTEVVLVARIVDTRTGEIVASARGEGQSSKGSGFTLGGLGGGVGGIGNVSSGAFRSSALGIATEQAVEMLAAELAAVAPALTGR